jgi:hypothetical protein
MNYIGTDPREGAVLVASTDVTSDTSSITMTGIFEPEVMYFINIMDYRPKNDDRTLMYRWLDSGGSAISHTNIQEGGRYGYSGGAGSTGAVSNTDRTGGYTNLTSGTGNASDEAGNAEMWCVPNTANEKMAFIMANWHTGTDENYGTIFTRGSRLNTSATRAEGIEFVCDNNTGGHQTNNVSIRVYSLGTTVNSVKSLNQTRNDVNYVESKYLGTSPKGQGWVKVAEITATDGVSNMEFLGCFTDRFKRYVIVATDCRPSTDSKNLLFQYDVSNSLETGTYNSAFFSADANGGSGSGHADDQTVGLVLNNIGTNGNEAGHVIMWLDPRSTNTPKFLGYRSIGQMADTTTRYITGSVAYNSATQMTGINWYWSSGNFESGTIKIYGVQE